MSTQTKGMRIRSGIQAGSPSASAPGATASQQAGGSISGKYPTFN